MGVVVWGWAVWFGRWSGRWVVWCGLGGWGCGGWLGVTRGWRLRGAQMRVLRKPICEPVENV